MGAAAGAIGKAGNIVGNMAGGGLYEPLSTSGRATAGGGGGKGGVGGKVPSVPALTPRGTYFDENGVEMTPQLGFGGAPAVPTASLTSPTQGQYSPVAPQGGFNVNQAAAGALQSAMGGTGAAMRGPLAVGAFMNPYQQEVINRTQMDIMRQQQMAQNQLGAQATAARAFGGSRQGVAEGVLAGEYGRMAGDIAAQQRQAGFNTALDAAMRDRAARLGAAQQMGALGQTAFGIGQSIQEQQARQGLLQQGLQQALIDAARAQYAGYTGAPAAALQAPLAALGVTPVPETKTSSYNPGLFDYLKYPLMGLAS